MDLSNRGGSVDNKVVSPNRRGRIGGLVRRLTPKGGTRILGAGLGLRLVHTTPGRDKPEILRDQRPTRKVSAMFIDMAFGVARPRPTT
jgi:hypothetical protein